MTINQNKFFIHLSFLLVLSLFFTTDYGQNGVAINTTGAAANGSAILDLSNSVSKGLLMPQVNSTSSVSSPATGLIVYQTGGTPGFYYYNGSTWVLLGSASGNGNYVLNQTTQQLNSNFNISNAGVIGTTLNVGSLSTLTGVSNTGAVTSTGGAISLNAGYAGNVTIGGAGNSTIAIGGTGNSTTNITSGNSGVYINATGNNNITIGNSANDLLLPKFSTANTVLYTAAGGILSGTIGSNDKFLIQRSGVLGFNTILASDLPSLAGNYILNQAAPTQNPGNFNIMGSGTIAGTFTSSGGAINLNSPTTGSSAFVTNINTGTNTGTVNIGGSTSQSIFIGKDLTGNTANPSAITIGSTADGVITTILSGANGVNINGTAGLNRPTFINTGTSTGPVTIGGSTTPTISLGTSAAGTVGVGSASSTTNVNGNPVSINTTNANTINIGGSTTISTNNQTINVGTNLKNGTVTIGTTSNDAGTTQVNIKSGISGTNGVNINAATGIATPTNINTGTTSGPVSIGNSTASNIYMPGFTTAGSVLYSSTTGGLIAVTAAGTSGQVLTSNGATAPNWTSLNTLTLGQGSASVFGSSSITISSTTYTLIPNLSQTITIPSNSTVIVSTNGGLFTNSSSSTGGTSVFIAIEVDNVIPANGAVQEVDCDNTTGFVNLGNSWAMTLSSSSLTGSHKFEVYAKFIGGTAGATVSGSSATNNFQQGTLTVTILKN